MAQIYGSLLLLLLWQEQVLFVSPADVLLFVVVFSRKL